MVLERSERYSRNLSQLNRECSCETKDLCWQTHYVLNREIPESKHIESPSDISNEQKGCLSEIESFSHRPPHSKDTMDEFYDELRGIIPRPL